VAEYVGGVATGDYVDVPIAVNNERRNKGKFITDFGGAIKAEYPELAEVFISLREPACVVDIPTCAADPGYPEQTYTSHNTGCSTDNVVIVQVPIINSDSATYEIAANSIQCNGMAVVHDAITGSTTVVLLVAELVSKLSAMGTWTSTDGDTTITLTGAVCTSITMPWIDAE